MGVDFKPLSGPQSRTRAAILNATASVLARDRPATLPEIATGASRTAPSRCKDFQERETPKFGPARGR